MASICGRLGVSTCGAVKAFFTQPGNKVARVVNSAKGVDKLAKTAKSAAELTASILEHTGGTGTDSFVTASKVAKGFGDARAVIALGNAFNGSLPATIQSARSCFAHLQAAGKPEEKCRSVLMKDVCVAHKRRAAADACAVVGGASYLTTFGVIRPLLFVNKLLAKPFLSSQAKNGLGSSVSYIMTANHAASVLGSALSISAERADCEERCNRILCGQADEVLGINNTMCEQFVRQRAVVGEKFRTLTRIKYSILSMIEKFLECVADVFKLVPLPITQSVRAIIAAGCTLTAAIIGLCTFWSKA
ncbi:hypothetical protein [Chlamydia suis]|uniref:Uncharacterized protein n=1 Tax=Chlamydia suis TaxID=83559 RepID=A0AAQ0ELH9_9CHLA|nr:hypothetical protein [Chlamydia suis]MEB2681348.1 hypothetical protein [Chlamydia suis]MEB2681782.1 hypothetical protein [Chlamydia suis]MEB2682703.1 hypothetical protein [Chlamydia suis]MEB2684055.1 hypothetical protein [Chlamydia suis]MEB2684518.1 hypothetical protein [Chlamydia suis]